MKSLWMLKNCYWSDLVMTVTANSTLAELGEPQHRSARRNYSSWRSEVAYDDSVWYVAEDYEKTLMVSIPTVQHQWMSNINILFHWRPSKILTSTFYFIGNLFLWKIATTDKKRNGKGLILPWTLLQVGGPASENCLKLCISSGYKAPIS